ncbi:MULTISPECIES: transposase family protein [unclassified Streptomyces]|uniref:transposase family protein n=1 Tax=unclassified Streptomyces TaxID=2593676 RepID=UPI002E2C3C46|nr:transposase family protein [Streptomyces sp. NBC_00228]
MNVPLWDILHIGVESLADVLFAGFDVRLTRVTKAAEGLVVEAVACGPPRRCTGCNSQATRVHSSYERGLAGLPVNGRSLTVRLRVRRFFCDRARCPRRTFVEQVAQLSERYRRSSLGLKQWQHAVAAELGGRPGQRLCRRLLLKAGRTRLLGLLTEPAVPEQAPRVLGVDDFAFRKGKGYDTLNLESDSDRSYLSDLVAIAITHEDKKAQALCSTRRRYLLRSHVPVSPGCFVSTTHARAHRDGGGPEGYLRRQGRGRRGAVRGSAGLQVDPGAGRDLQP